MPRAAFGAATVPQLRVPVTGTPAAGAAPEVPVAAAGAAPQVPAHHSPSPEPHTGRRFLGLAHKMAAVRLKVRRKRSKRSAMLWWLLLELVLPGAAPRVPGRSGTRKQFSEATVVVGSRTHHHIDSRSRLTVGDMVGKVTQGGG